MTVSKLPEFVARAVYQLKDALDFPSADKYSRETGPVAVITRKGEKNTLNIYVNGEPRSFTLNNSEKPGEFYVDVPALNEQTPGFRLEGKVNEIIENLNSKMAVILADAKSLVVPKDAIQYGFRSLWHTAEDSPCSASIVYHPSSPVVKDLHVFKLQSPEMGLAFKTL